MPGLCRFVFFFCVCVNQIKSPEIFSQAPAQAALLPAAQLEARSPHGAGRCVTGPQLSRASVLSLEIDADQAKPKSCGDVQPLEVEGRGDGARTSLAAAGACPRAVQPRGREKPHENCSFYGGTRAKARSSAPLKHPLWLK